MYKREKNFKKSRQYMEDPIYKNERPNEKEGEPQVGISEKALKDLPKSTYSFLADPYAASLPTANPYAIVTKFNKTVGGTYEGDENIDGGNIQQYPNSLRSNFLGITDFIRLPISINYRYLPSRLVYSQKLDEDTGLPAEAGTVNYSGPIAPKGSDNTYTGSKLVDQQRQAFAEATSILNSTTFTQMAIKDYFIVTDLAMGSAPRDEDKRIETPNATSGTPAKYIKPKYTYPYTQLNDVLYGASRYYQIFLQEVVNTITSYNSFRLKQGTMIRSSYNRETPKLNGLFGILNKKTFTNLIDGLCLGVMGEYIDREWVGQINMLNVMPSRRSNAMMDPVLELSVRNVHPTLFQMYLDTGGTPELIFDDSMLSFNSPLSEDPVSVWTAFDSLQRYFSAEDTMAWARSTNPSTETETERYNKIKWNIDVVLQAVTVFKTLFNDVREVFDTVSRANLNTWVKQFRPAVIKDTDASLFHNMIVEDIFKTVMSGAQTISFDDATKRWRFFTLYNLYNGVPEYDDKAGGAFLSFSAKQLNVDSDSDETIGYLPIAFYYDSPDYGTPTVKAVTRDGAEYNIVSEAVTMSLNAQLARLAPLPSQATLQIRVPKVPTDADLTIGQISHSIHALSTVFGLAKYDGHVVIDPDFVCAYQEEILDITNNAINYARATAAFRGTPVQYDSIGFAKFGQK